MLTNRAISRVSLYGDWANDLGASILVGSSGALCSPAKPLPLAQKRLSTFTVGE